MPQQVPHMIPDNTKPTPITVNRHGGVYTPVTPVNMFNTRSRQLQVKDLMDNHVTTINSPTPTPLNIAPIMRPSGEYW